MSKRDEAGESQRRSPERLAASVEGDPRWATVRARDARAEGTFVYSVETTGVYCRPSCGARLPRPENVAFHLTPVEAERAGFRPCKRCKPTEVPLGERRAALVAELCRRIESAEEAPTLEALAIHAGLSVFHVQRVFKMIVGVTPREYAAAHRERRLRGALSTSSTVTEAIHEAGYGASGRFYERSSEVLGMTPTEYRAGGEALAIRYAIAPSSLGAVLVAATLRGVCAIFLGDDPEALVKDLERRFPRARSLEADAGFHALVARVVALVEAPLGAGPKESTSALPLDIRGTAFQQRVWKALAAIPAGETRTYADIARAIGAPSAVRAVAGACGANPVSVVIPCHRVVRTDGGLSGYRWGVERKRELLAREGRRAPRAKKDA